MFSGQLPQLIDPRKFADQGVQIEGQTSIGNLPRLAEYRDSDQQMVSASLQFGRDEDDRRRVTGHVSASLSLPCQRCLEPVTYQIDARVDLVMVWDEEQMKALPEHLDPMMISEDKVPLAELLEEELLLALPLVALHDTCPTSLVREHAQTDADAGAVKPDNPFAVLAKLKRQQD